MNCVVSRRVDEDATKVNLVVNRDCPEVNQHKHGNEEKVVQREDVREYVIRNSLTEAVQWVERVGAVWACEAVGVVQLVQTAIEDWVMKSTMEPIHHEVSEDEKQWDTQEEVPPSVLIDILVHLAVSTVREEGRRQQWDRHHWDGGQRNVLLVGHLLREILLVDGWREETRLVPHKEEEVAHRGEAVVKEGPANG